MKDGMMMLLTALADCVSPRLVRYPAAKLCLGAQRDTLRTCPLRAVLQIASKKEGGKHDMGQVR